MVKFSKQLEAQLIPQWKDAFVNYWQLKKHIKKIKLSRKPRQPPHDLNGDFGRTIFDSIRSLAHRFSNKLHGSSENSIEIIQVRKRTMEEGNGEEVYQTELAQLFSEEDGVRVFFTSLDEELNKVNLFYKARESEFLERGKILNKQLQILMDIKQIISDWRRKQPGSVALSRSWSSSPRNSSFSESPTEENDSASETSSQTDEVIAALERNGVSFINATTMTKTKKGKPKMSMRIDIPDGTTATQTIVAVTSMLWEDLVNNTKKEGTGDFINKKKIRCAEKTIRSAFVELYRGLGLLKTYSSLNMVAFAKILKKFDKVSNQQASTNYLRTVKRSHFISSDKVVRLMDEVESMFTKHFANNDRKKAMKFLRPQQPKDSQMVTFFVGLFTGCFVSLFCVYIMLAHLSGVFSASSQTPYMETVYPVFSVFALISLHLFMYGCNLFMWKSTRINYNFIFEFQPSTALKYRDAFLICTTFMTAVVGAMIIHLLLRASGFSPSHVDTIPGILLLIFIALLVCPFDTLYRPTRFCFLRVMRNIVCSPFYKVVLVDFFMADQLTSQIQLLRQLESTACYFLAGNFRTHHHETCKEGRFFKELSYVISFLPYYWRALQCARKWYDKNDISNLANMGKYVSAMVAAGVRLAYNNSQNRSHLGFAIVLVTSVVATLYQLYWDFVKDWGLLNRSSKNPWLRDRLILKKKSIYYLSMALNVVLRIAWVEAVIKLRNQSVVEHNLLEFFLASLEVIRRGHWNFYRLENEYLNNVGKFRPVQAVPLPFDEMDSDD
ncbi:hypothetical protein SLEP1_g346 [Rubroshorea leprosula]|uniref:Phosphate transporter PHO1 n=1 Tax=Rubroshorea leprosula TaxID=152421 RepID=A0AAV5HL56_9ROSI|nr:hypothetical protein SLEP1_g346 [Rubroshorea leprosula]